MTRRINSSNHPHVVYESLSRYLESFCPRSQIASISFGDKFLDLNFVFKGHAKPLLVFFGGAVDQSKTIVPNFPGVSYANQLDSNVLSIADPSLYYDDSLRSCFYLGSESINLQRIMPQIIDDARRKVAAPKVVMYGSSGGGYPVLCMSQLMHNVECIANCAATSVARHPNRQMIADYFRLVWGADSHEKVEEARRRLPLLDLTQSFDASRNNVYIFINKGDHKNIEGHFIPFSGFDPRKSEDNLRASNRLLYIMDNWGEKHMHPPARILRSVMTKIIQAEKGLPSADIIGHYSSIAATP